MGFSLRAGAVIAHPWHSALYLWGSSWLLNEHLVLSLDRSCEVTLPVTRSPHASRGNTVRIYRAKPSLIIAESAGLASAWCLIDAWNCLLNGLGLGLRVSSDQEKPKLCSFNRPAQSRSSRPHQPVLGLGVPSGPLEPGYVITVCTPPIFSHPLLLQCPPAWPPFVCGLSLGAGAHFATHTADWKCQRISGPWK